ncbi:DUF4859 domain-containing protein [Leeuwenhoekiella parthenopeia]|uniref:DUF4859 domain-containing protein n=1 Tax=Leeuwenhoekiella parthenopeia TaxID=2890320 RepID=A0ABS8GWB2_9FLAO|nr:DUF4859 domain-containing protein [Leeuwenhoekiella parthenopeia]MCC4214194.1 DUF4859 domain-containing protein [Leeuwenhoekiella parthenopeia]
MLNIERIITILLLAFTLISCTSDNVETIAEEENPEELGLEIYKPIEFGNMDYEDNSSKWSFERSRQSEHFILFWDAKYQNNDPGSAAVPEKYRVDIEELMNKAEEFYTLNVQQLKFADLNVENTKLNTYKMMIFLYYQDEWLATGAGYDDTIGALWISPGTTQPAGHTLAHEIGHSFQYQVNADLGNGHGFRYGFGGNGGNAFWEQTAQWQAFKAFPSQIFTAFDFAVYIDNYNKHIHHENYRYASYFIHYYWTQLHGQDFIGKLWREAQQPEDPVQAYMRITGIDAKAFNDEIYEAASKMVTWDLDELRDLGEEYIGAQKYDYTTRSDGTHVVAKDFAPQGTGYNVIPLKIPEADTQVSVNFKGLPNETGFNAVDASIAGWRYGFVALKNNGARVYGTMQSSAEGEHSFTVPENCSKLWLVVTGAPTQYSPHAWDDDNSNDAEWPYAVKFTNTNILGYFDSSGKETPESIDFEYDVSFAADAEAYSGKIINIDIEKLTNAFQLSTNDIKAKMGDAIKFYAINSNGDLISETTASGYGHWFNAAGDVIGWGDNAYVFSEFDEVGLKFKTGQYPGRLKTGDAYTVRQALVYEYESGKSAQATFTFKIKIE